MKQPLLWLTLACGLLLAACGGTTPTGDAGLAAAPTSAPAAPTAASAAGAAATGVQTFKIVPDQSKVSYEVGEVFLNQGNRYNVAVGTTQSVSGEISFDAASPQNSKVGPLTIDISTFQSDNGRRDNAIRNRWLESAKFPQAVFTPTQIAGLPASYTPGQQITLQITGDLKVREVTRPTTFEVSGKIENNTMSGVATTQVKMSDFGFSPPDIGGIVKAEDDVKITFEFVAQP